MEKLNTIGACPEAPIEATQSDEIERRFHTALKEADVIESRLNAALNRLNYDEPRAQEGSPAQPPPPNPAEPPFETRINDCVSSLNRILCRLDRHADRLERFV